LTSVGSEKHGKLSSSGRVLPANLNSLGTPRKMSLLSGKILQTGSEMEQTLTDALVRSG